MGWPKGMKRKGHVNKDGTAHAGKGDKIRAIRANPERYKALRADPVVPTVKKALTVLFPTGGITGLAANAVIKGATGRPVIEPCPKCGYAYADGGYCEDCGWTVWNDPRKKAA